MNPLGEYNLDDVQDMWSIFKDMLDMDFPLDELKLIHHTIKAFDDQTCDVDVPLARKELANERRKKTLLFKNKENDYMREKLGVIKDNSIRIRDIVTRLEQVQTIVTKEYHDRTKILELNKK